MSYYDDDDLIPSFMRQQTPRVNQTSYLRTDGNTARFANQREVSPQRRNTTYYKNPNQRQIAHGTVRIRRKPTLKMKLKKVAIHMLRKPARGLYKICLKLEKNSQPKTMRQIKRQRVRAIRIVIGTISVVIVGTILVNAFIPTIDSKGQTNDQYEIEYVLGNDLPTDDEYEIIIETPTETPPVEEEMNVDLTFEARLNSINPTGQFEVGSEVQDYFLMVLNDNEYMVSLFKKYGEMYGVDPYLLIAKAMQESSFNHNACLPGGANYNGYGVGIMQHESPDGREIVAHNYETGEDDVMYVTMDNAIDLEMNIKMGAMHFQKCIERNNGNVLIALQSYNYGQGMMNSILSTYAKTKNLTVDAVKMLYSDTAWLEQVNDAHNNAWRYIGDWKGYYGDANYIKNVLKNFVGDKVCYKYNGETCIFDLNSLELAVVNDTVKVIS